MKKIFFNPFAVLVLLIIVTGCSSCKKAEPTAASDFKWTFNGGTATVANLHKAFTISKTILATRGSNILSFDISLSVSSFNTGMYTITTGGANSILYIDNSGNNYTAAAGTINITSYANNLLSGNFTTTVTGGAGGPYSLTGSFIDTPIEF